jgi:phage terminase small subunit
MGRSKKPAEKPQDERARKPTKRQKRFAEELLTDPQLRQGEAAKRAGYSEKNADAIASRLVKKSHVQEAIQSAMDARSERTGITADYVLETIQETIERCRQAEPVKDQMGRPVLIQGSDGDLVPAYIFDARNVLKGAELLGKHLKLFTEKHEVTGKDGGPIKLEDLVAGAGAEKAQPK